MKAAIYSRVSTEDQDFSKQTNELKDYAKKENIEVVYIFEEKASGFIKDRPEFEKVKQLTKDDVDIILVWELSRLSRKSIYIQTQVEEFAEKGISIYSKKENLQTLNEDGSKNQTSMFTIAVISMMAEQEVATFKERVITSKRNKIFRQGNSYTYKPAYGYYYNTETKELSINEEEAEVVRRIFQLSADGYSAYRIPVVLNADGLKTRTGKNWTYATVSDMLVNPVYKGEAKYRLKSEKPKQGKKYKKILESATVEAPAIISAELFELSIKGMKDRTNRSKSSGVKHFQLLRGLIKCPYCKVSYTYGASRDSYCCHEKYSKATNKTEVCLSKSIRGKNIEFIVWKLVKKLFNNELAANKTEEQVEPLKNEIEALEQQIKGLEKVQQELTAKANTIVNAAIEIKIQFPNMVDLYNNKLNEVESINKEAGKYLQEKDLILKQIESKENQIKAIKSITDTTVIVDSITDDIEKYNLLHKVIESMIIYGTGYNSLIAIHLTTGTVVYIGYYPLKRYYTVVNPTNDAYFDEENKIAIVKGLDNIPTKDNFSFDTTVREINIDQFIEYIDREEERKYLPE